MFLHCGRSSGEEDENDEALDLEDTLSQPGSEAFLTSVLAYLLEPFSMPDSLPRNLPDLLDAIGVAQQHIQQCLTHTRLAYGVLRAIHAFMRSHGWKTSPNVAADGKEEAALSLMARVLRGVSAEGDRKGVTRDVVWIGRVVRCVASP